MVSRKSQEQERVLFGTSPVERGWGVPTRVLKPQLPQRQRICSTSSPAAPLSSPVSSCGVWLAILSEELRPSQIR